ncbi:MAG: HEAT repeat domain-containing protein [Candidatus Omnitrophica bacterium]|nr:HEAT repeat domain-containing protein [Candidatus Omnitrophota bacterium]
MKKNNMIIALAIIAVIILAISGIVKKEGLSFHESMSFQKRIDLLLNDAMKRRNKNASGKDLKQAQRAVIELSKLDKENDLTPYLLEILKEEDNDNKKIIVVSLLSSTKNKELKKEVFEASKALYEDTANSSLKTAVLMLLGNIRTKDSTDMLLDIIQNTSNMSDLYVAILSVGDHKDERAVALLVEKSKVPNVQIRDAAEYSLKKITDKSFIPEEILSPKTLLDRKKILDRDELLLEKVNEKLDSVNEVK